MCIAFLCRSCATVIAGSFTQPSQRQSHSLEPPVLVQQQTAGRQWLCHPPLSTVLKPAWLAVRGPRPAAEPSVPADPANAHDAQCSAVPLLGPVSVRLCSRRLPLKAGKTIQICCPCTTLQLRRRRVGRRAQAAEQRRHVRPTRRQDRHSSRQVRCGGCETAVASRWPSSDAPAVPAPENLERSVTPHRGGVTAAARRLRNRGDRAARRRRSWTCAPAARSSCRTSPAPGS